MKIFHKWNFGSNKKLAKKLLQLVLSGKKTATTSLYSPNKKLPKFGEFGAILDSNKKQICVIQYTKVEVKLFLEVDMGFIQKEGEGDETVEEWRKKHRKFFNLKNDNIKVVCEEFKVVKIKYDAILVLGRGIDKNGKMPEVAYASVRKAKELYDDGYADHIIFSGKGSYKSEFIPPKTEAETMSDYAVSLGVSCSTIIIEDKSEATVLNICNVKQKILIPRKWRNIACISFYPLKPRMEKNFHTVLGLNYRCDFIDTDCRFPSEIEKQKEKSEREKLDGEVAEFFKGIKPGDDKKICKKAIAEIKRRKIKFNKSLCMK